MTQQAKGLAAAGLVVAVAGAGWFAWHSPRLTAVTPEVSSSRWGQPVQVHGTGFSPGLSLKLGAPLGKELPLEVLSSTLAVGSLPLDVALEGEEANVPVSLSRGEGEATLRLVDTRKTPDFTALAAFTEGTLAVLSSTTDVLYLVRPDGMEVTVATARGPSALAMERSKEGERLWVAHRGAPVLRAYGPDGRQLLELKAPVEASALLSGNDGRLYVAEEATHSVVALNSASGAELWRTPVAARPGALALAGEYLAVGSTATGEVELLDLERGTAEPAIATGSSAVRALAWVPANDRLLVANAGPLEGPPASGGITVLDLDAWRVLRHVPSGGGTPGGMAMDAAGTVVALSDLATGEVRTLDAEKLSGDSDEEARNALLMEAAYPPTRGPCVAWAVDWGAGDGLLRVLDRAGGTVAAYATMGGPGRVARVAFNAVARQAQTSPGLALYMIEPTRSGKSCFGCHQEGEAVGRARLPGAGEAVRVPLLRGRPEQELTEALARHPGLSRAGAELQAAARWLSSLPPEPNPRLLPSGAPPETVTLPSGAVGRPGAGMKVADALGCAKCHAPSGQSLAGLWRRWPLFRDGRAGLNPRDRDALGAALRVHGEGVTLPASDADRNDLEAWLMVQ